LWSQWCFDKELLGLSLNSVSTVSPHYSQHDSSHSMSIVREIEKVLGNNIIKLTYVDCWLILEASYWHDIGMLITDSEKREYIDSAEFSAFLSEISSSDHDLTTYANTLRDHLDGVSNPPLVDLEHALRYVIADYVRQNHSSRSKKI